MAGPGRGRPARPALTRSTESTGWGELPGGRSHGAGRIEPGRIEPGRIELRADRAGHRPGVQGTLDAPQRVAEADQGDAGRGGEEPEVDLRQQGDRQGCDGANGKERGGPPGEDAGAEECDAEDAASGEVGEAGDLAEGDHQAEVAGRVAAGNGHGEDVGDVAG